MPTSNSHAAQILSFGHPLKVPFSPFVHDNAKMWFWAAEKLFAGSNIFDDDHHFAAILWALPIATASVFREQFDSPPQSHKYAFAKDIIIKHFSKNQFERIEALIDRVELVDTKPSEIYAQAKQIAGDAMSHVTRKGNAQTIPDRYLLAFIQDVSTVPSGKRVFWKVDFKKAFHQIRIDEEDIPKTAITTPFGLFEFRFMTFGLCNAAQSFQRFIDELLNGLDFVFPYIDDFLIQG